MDPIFTHFMTPIHFEHPLKEGLDGVIPENFKKNGEFRSLADPLGGQSWPDFFLGLFYFFWPSPDFF